MIISPSRNFAFVHIHKTAGEAVTLALMPYLGPGDLTLGASQAGRIRDLRYRRAHGISKHSPARALRDYAGAEVWAGYFTFAIVRHPYDRARSLYTYLQQMFERRDGVSAKNIAYRMPGLRRADPLGWPGVQAVRETADFSEFIRHPKFRGDPGSRPQRDMLADADGALLVDFVGHFDRLEADFGVITDRIGLGPVPLPRHNVSAGTTPRAALAEADRAVLRDLYAVDFAAFGFEESV